MVLDGLSNSIIRSWKILILKRAGFCWPFFMGAILISIGIARWGLLLKVLNNYSASIKILFLLKKMVSHRGQQNFLLNEKQAFMVSILAISVILIFVTI